MATATPSRPPLDPALIGPWEAYRMWSCTSRFLKRRLDQLTSWSLGLAIGGSIAATLAEQLKTVSAPPQVAPVTTVLGVIATAAIAVAAYLSQQAQGDNRVNFWTRSRSAAESLKSGIFIYRAGAPPFDAADRALQIKLRTEKILNEMKGVETRQPAPDNGSDLSPLTVGQYIQVRAQEQADWYARRARDHQRSADSCRRATSLLLGVATILTALSATVRGVSVWAPVVATMAASITAYLKNQQYQMLTASYSATLIRLKVLIGNWLASGKTDADKVERDAFIQSCEETMSAENGSWSALWTKN